MPRQDVQTDLDNVSSGQATHARFANHEKQHAYSTNSNSEILQSHA